MPPSGRIRLDGGTIVDPADGRLSGPVSILVDQGRIVSIDAADAVRSDSATRRIDVAGRFVVPGYNDMHSHVLDLENPSGALALMLAEGVTGFRQMAGSARLLERRRSGALGLGVQAPALHEMPGDVLTPLNASSQQAVVEEIRTQQQQGADFIKAGMMSPEVFEAALKEARRCGIPLLGHLQEGFDAGRAALAGFRCIEHLGPGATLWTSCSTLNGQLLDEHVTPKFDLRIFRIPFMRTLFLHWFKTVLINPAAFAAPVHVQRLQRALDTFDEGRCQALMSRFVSEGTWHVPTLVRLRTSELADAPEYQTSACLRFMPRANVRKWRKVTARFHRLPEAVRRTYAQAYPKQLQLTKTLADAGVRMMAGTDGGWLSGPGLTLQEEFAELARAGLSPLAILQMTTSNAAQYLGREDRMGRVAPGFEADMVVLEANPLERTENLGRIAAVVRAGFHYSKSELQELRDQVAAGGGFLH